MQYILMHKDIPVAKLDLDDATCVISRIVQLYAPAHLPVGVAVRHGVADRAQLNDWWADRSIPASRSGVGHLLDTLQLPNTRLLLTRCFGLSLSDQYWIKPADRPDLCWQAVNFFDNAFSQDIGDILLGKPAAKAAFDLHSPDNTSDGCLKKRWKIMDGKRCLVKAGSAPLMLQPFHEVIASVIMQKLHIPHVPYWLQWDGEVPYSVCEDFIDQNTELVPAWRLLLTGKKDNSTSLYRHYINCCQSVGVADIVHAVDQMLVVDYIIANQDRHLNNFGLIRDADTLQYIGAAPIFDSGSSLGYDMLPPQILVGKTGECKPFKKKHEEQIRLVTDFSWIDFHALQDIEADIKNVFKDAGMYADENRINAVIAAVKHRIANLQALAQQRVAVVDNVADDVTENVAQTYTNGHG